MGNLISELLTVNRKLQFPPGKPQSKKEPKPFSWGTLYADKHFKLVLSFELRQPTKYPFKFNSLFLKSSKSGKRIEYPCKS